MVGILLVQSPPHLYTSIKKDTQTPSIPPTPMVILQTWLRSRSTEKVNDQSVHVFSPKELKRIGSDIGAQLSVLARVSL